MINNEVKVGSEGYISYSNDISADINSEWEHVPYVCDFKFSEITKKGSISIAFKNSKDKFYNLQDKNISLKYAIVLNGLDENNPDETLLINNICFTDKIFDGDNSNNDELVTCVYKFNGNYRWV